MSDNTHRFPSDSDTTPLPPYSGSTATSGRSDTEVLPPYDPSGGSTGQVGPVGPAGSGPTPPLHDAPAGRSPRPRRRTAGILAGALVLGVGGGVLGATGYDALSDEPAAVSSPSPAATNASAREPLSSSGSDDSSDESGTTDSTGAEAPADSVEGVAAAVLPSVVKINVSGAAGSGSGSGVVISEDGEILTNNHVVEVAADGGQLSVSFDDGSSADASIVGTDPVTDLAVIQADGVSDLTPAAIGDSDALGVGEEVVAIGSPFGLEATVTSGIVSALNRPVAISEASASAEAPDTVYPAIQTDAAINPGNSGGPLVNMAGEVVGINSSIRSNSTSLSGEGGSIGLGFAIPITQVLPVVEQLRNGETATHARLGVTVANTPDDNGLANGAEIQEVQEGSGGAEAGLQPGDLVTRVDDKPISTIDALVATIRGYRPGDTVTLVVQRDGETQTLEATLDSDADTSSP
ncbi:PDZ domain-containing protein [Nocardioides sp. HDW12B]|uniref:S1C family serine protease n=1 Tax=Nocardioides sp. HDW12B TaxID=2714939 RepID=UPI00140A8C46|nr:trypsin-like peptidase domain-containing protein [Nocardioides sp. HDW12B]QIK67777.1 PDZ domain-containing protein [Nocardioides sp. HDW12B]